MDLNGGKMARFIAHYVKTKHLQPLIECTDMLHNVRAILELMKKKWHVITSNKTEESCCEGWNEKEIEKELWIRWIK